MKYKVNEIFYSIQGEGYYTGKPCVFIRLSGCNLKCPFCDTDHKKYDLLNEYEIARKILHNFPAAKHIVITGGEPALVDLFPLTARLSSRFIQIETNGTTPLSGLFNWVTCSPKREKKFKYVVLPDELKYVVDDQFGLDNVNLEFSGSIYLQPKDNEKKYINKCIQLIKENGKCRLSLQTHKLLKIR